MEKIKVGYYVRFRTLSNEVKIRKIIKIDNNIYELDKNEVTTDKYIIGEPSESILDLIHFGDYVNSLPVVHNSKDNGGNIVIVVNGNVYTEEEIKSVVTKEQFNSVKYEVE